MTLIYIQDVKKSEYEKKIVLDVSALPFLDLIIKEYRDYVIFIPHTMIQLLDKGDFDTFLKIMKYWTFRDYTIADFEKIRGYLRDEPNLGSTGDEYPDTADNTEYRNKPWLRFYNRLYNSKMGPRKRDVNHAFKNIVRQIVFFFDKTGAAIFAIGNRLMGILSKLMDTFSAIVKDIRAKISSILERDLKRRGGFRRKLGIFLIIVITTERVISIINEIRNLFHGILPDFHEINTDILELIALAIDP